MNFSVIFLPYSIIIGYISFQPPNAGDDGGQLGVPYVGLDAKGGLQMSLLLIMTL